MNKSSQKIKSIATKIQKVIRDGFRHDPYIGDLEGLFRSHCDWHSSVHAHWTLLNISRITRDEIGLSAVLSRLSETAIQLEQQRLNQDPHFELPYGQAWLLLLIRELEIHHKPSPALMQLKNETIERVGTWLEKNIFPETNPNTYHSWLMTYFLFQKSKALLGYKQSSYLQNKLYSASLLDDDMDPKDYFSSETLLKILRQQPLETFDLFAKIKQLGAITNSNSHHLGKIISRSWMTPMNNKNSLAHALRFTDEILKNPSLWSQNFETLGHWVPQFLWLGLWLSMGEP